MPRLSILALTMALLSGMVGCSQGAEHPGSHPQEAAVYESGGKLSEPIRALWMIAQRKQIQQMTIMGVNQRLKPLRISPSQPKCRRMPNGFMPMPQALKVGLSIPPFKAAKPAY